MMKKMMKRRKEEDEEKEDDKNSITCLFKKICIGDRELKLIGIAMET
jgi:hypothetical protein